MVSKVSVRHLSILTPCVFPAITCFTATFLQTSTELPDVWRIFLPAIFLSKGQMGSKFSYIWHWSKPFWESNDFRIHGPYRIDLFLVEMIDLNRKLSMILGTIPFIYTQWSMCSSFKFPSLPRRSSSVSGPSGWVKGDLLRENCRWHVVDLRTVVTSRKVCTVGRQKSRFRIQQKTMVFQTFRKWIFQLPCFLVFVFI